MAITLSGDNGITNVNGTAAAPAITGTDTDTGMYFGTNTVALSTSGTAALTVDASQNVGIGTSSPDSKITLAGYTGGVYNTAFNYQSQYNFIVCGTSGYTMFRNAAGTTLAQIDNAGVLSFNSGYGSAATAYGCRAWCKFTSTTTPSISASGNIASVTYSATAQYTIAFTNAMPDANYAVVTGGNYNNAAGNYTFGTSIYSQSTSSFVIQTWTTGTAGLWTTAGFVYFSVFR